MGAYSGRFFCPRNWLISAHGRLFGWALIPMNTVIQYQTVLAITGAWKGSCRSKLYEELGWESLSDRRWCRHILQVHKIVSGKTPSHPKNKFPRLRRPLYRQNNSNTFHELNANLWGTRVVSFPTQLPLGIMLLLILMIFHLSVFLQNIFYLWFV